MAIATVALKMELERMSTVIKKDQRYRAPSGYRNGRWNVLKELFAFLVHLFGINKRQMFFTMLEVKWLLEALK